MLQFNLGSSFILICPQYFVQTFKIFYNNSFMMPLTKWLLLLELFFNLSKDHFIATKLCLSKVFAVTIF